MSIYEEFGARSIYNLAGTSTRVGGPILSEEVANAMVEASQHSVDMTELQASASDYISKITGSELNCNPPSSTFGQETFISRPSILSSRVKAKAISLYC